ncbi:MAG: pitrilysin family protein, partial [Planctomycetota bacterium]
SELMGVSHYLEHMMFKGTDELDADAINRGFDDLGASNNAFTSREMTCFYAHTLPEGLGSATELLSAMMRPALRDSDFDTEKNVIIEEIAMYADNPFWVLYEETTARRYGQAPLGHRVLGTKDTITALQRDQMHAYFRERYASDAMIVAFAGRVNFERSLEQVRSLCGGWKATGVSREHTLPPRASGAFELRDPRVNRGYLIGVSDAPAVGSEHRHAAALLAQILGGEDNSRLHWALIETGLAEEAQAAYDGMDRHGEFFVYASGDPERLGDIEEIMRREISNLRDSLVEDDLARLRSKAITGMTLAGERPAGRMMRLGRTWTMLGRYTTLDEELASLSKVTLDDLKSVCDGFPFDNWLLGTMRPA